ncbi:MAG TPA: hypothetical protein VJK54_10175 [Chthoniobacterales bacterium]|nr:hypothetical protein [Chthoniobacterales bacterium]
MKKIIPSFILTSLVSSSFLLAQSEYDQDTGYRLQGTGLKTAELPLKDLTVQRAESTTNCNNQGSDLGCYLLMDPAELKPLEEGIEDLRGVFRSSGESGVPSKVAVNPVASSYSSVESSSSSVAIAESRKRACEESAAEKLRKLQEWSQASNAEKILIRINEVFVRKDIITKALKKWNYGYGLYHNLVPSEARNHALDVIDRVFQEKSHAFLTQAKEDGAVAASIGAAMFEKAWGSRNPHDKEYLYALWPEAMALEMERDKKIQEMRNNIFSHSDQVWKDYLKLPEALNGCDDSSYENSRELEERAYEEYAKFILGEAQEAAQTQYTSIAEGVWAARVKEAVHSASQAASKVDELKERRYKQSLAFQSAERDFLRAVAIVEAEQDAWKKAWSQDFQMEEANKAKIYKDVIKEKIPFEEALNKPQDYYLIESKLADHPWNAFPMSEVLGSKVFKIREPITIALKKWNYRYGLYQDSVPSEARSYALDVLDRVFQGKAHVFFTKAKEDGAIASSIGAAMFEKVWASTNSHDKEFLYAIWPEAMTLEEERDKKIQGMRSNIFSNADQTWKDYVKPPEAPEDSAYTHAMELEEKASEEYAKFILGEALKAAQTQYTSIAEGVWAARVKEAACLASQAASKIDKLKEETHQAMILSVAPWLEERFKTTVFYANDCDFSEVAAERAMTNIPGREEAWRYLIEGNDPTVGEGWNSITRVNWKKDKNVEDIFALRAEERKGFERAYQAAKRDFLRAVLIVEAEQDAWKKAWSQDFQTTEANKAKIYKDAVTTNVPLGVLKG